MKTPKYELSLLELMLYERASELVCKKYENSCKNYDGSITNDEEYSLFLKYNKIHENLLIELRKRLDDIA